MRAGWPGALALLAALSCGVGAFETAAVGEPAAKRFVPAMQEAVDAPRRAPPPATGALVPEDDSRARRVTSFTPWSGKSAPRFVVDADEREGWEDSRQLRAERRAFEGAPPVIPHPVDFAGGRQTCLDCHGEGMAIGEMVAHTMSHAPLASCEQCHVEEESSVFDVERAPTNLFVGRESPGRGTRAQPFAPPTIPHTTQMRQNCLACHGEFGWPGLRIDHAGRASCVQCHVAAGPVPARPPPGG